MASTGIKSCSDREDNDNVKRDLKYPKRSIALKRYWREYKKKYGKRYTYERTKKHREKMAKIKTGTKHSIESRKKISKNHADVSGKNNPMYGKKRPEYVKEAVRKANTGRRHENYAKPMLGKKHSTETIEKMRLAQKGEKGSNWQGGKTEIHQLIRVSSQYKQWRNDVYKRDDYTCQLCREKGGELNADHIKPFALFPELRFSIDNGRTLCINCHKTTDNYGYKLSNKIRIKI